jgi:acyl carrier protein
MIDNDILVKLTDIFREVFDDDTLTITPDTTADDIARWDSFNHINIIVGTEMRFGVKFQTAEIESLKNVGELVNLIAARSTRS